MKDPILKELERQDKEIEELKATYAAQHDDVEESIAKSEELLKSLGYTDEDLNRLKFEVMD